MEDILMRVAAESPWAVVAFYVLTRVNTTLEKLTRAVEGFGARIDKLENELHTQRCS